MSSHNLLYDFIEKEKANVSLISTRIPINHPAEIYQIFVETVLIRESVAISRRKIDFESILRYSRFQIVLQLPHRT